MRLVSHRSPAAARYNSGPVLPTPHSFRPESLVGSTLDGRYLLTAHLASGGMGAVFRAEQVYMRKELALKLLRPELSSLPDIAERFRREAEIAASLEHDHIVRVTDFGRSPEGWLFLAMELLHGQSLFERLRGEARFDPPQAVAVLVGICRGLDAAHQRGVVHRDLKPENVFLTGSGGVKILDFGIAKLQGLRSPSETQAGVVVGTPEYLSPEQALGDAVDARADVYAVGLIGWRMLVGHHPFQTEDARGLVMMQATRPVPPLTGQRPDLAEWPGLTAALERACSKDPAARHPTAGALADELAACLGPAAGTPEAALAVRAPPFPTASPRPAPSPAAFAPGGAHFRASEELAPTLVASPGAATGALEAAAPWRALLARHRRPLALAACLALAGLALGVLAAWRWAEQRPALRAQELLAANRPEAARDVLARALERRPRDAQLLVLHGRTLHRLGGEDAAAVEAYGAALDLDPRALDPAALEDLSGSLRDPRVGERAARLLARAGPAAVPAVLASARAGPGPARLRALELVRELGAESRLDRVAAYADLLADPDCDVRRTAARRLGDLGSPAALPALGDLARQTREVRGLLGFPQHVPACGAVEAEAAIRRLAPGQRGAR